MYIGCLACNYAATHHEYNGFQQPQQADGGGGRAWILTQNPRHCIKMGTPLLFTGTPDLCTDNLRLLVIAPVIQKTSGRIREQPKTQPECDNLTLAEKYLVAPFSSCHALGFVKSQVVWFRFFWAVTRGSSNSTNL